MPLHVPVPGRALSPQMERLHTVIERNPGIRRGDLALRMEVKPKTVDTYIWVMRRAGLIRHDGKGWHKAADWPWSRRAVPSSVWDLARVL
jgi:hypothetical protein